MTRKERRKTLPDGTGPKEEVVRAVTEKAEEGSIACAVAHALVGELRVRSEEVGLAADVQGIQIVKCQLGLFGYGTPKGSIVKPAPEIAPDLKQAIERSLVNGRLSCANAWQIAEELGITRLGVGSACEAMKVKISSCQLGAF